MEQLEGSPTVVKESRGCKLQKSFYGLKQAPKRWHLKFDNFMQRNGYRICEMDHYCYLMKFGSSYIILLLYDDDGSTTGANMQEINKLKRQLSKEFEMKDLGISKQILEMSIARDKAVEF